MRKRKTHKQFLEEVYGLVGNDYEVLSDYKRGITKVLMKHNICNHEWGVTPGHFLGGTRCPRCSRKKSDKKRMLTQSEFIKKVKEVHGNDFLVIDDYKGSHTRIRVKHLICGHTYKVTPTNLTTGKGCPLCADKVRGKDRTLSQQEYSNRVKKRFGSEYEPIDDYVNDITPILVRHTTCGHEWKVKPSNFVRRGTGCPRCNESKGERLISKYLDYSLYNYKTQYRIKDCRRTFPLPFDFAVFHKSELVCLIEYEGRQHFEPIDFFGGMSNLKDLQERDQIKRDYCKANNILLIEIPYWEEDIEGLLHKKLNEIHRINNITSEQLSLFN
ncbi:hypothetical protein [Siminovitchia terrae]|uniref:hypothetical protein n=1 Tax=Siminovitchia terrae TaxID=1914933 RepID=UPI0028ACB18E|nr:hypothetical protein [Siminovitchia terrae]